MATAMLDVELATGEGDLGYHRIPPYLRQFTADAARQAQTALLEWAAAVAEWQAAPTLCTRCGAPMGGDIAPGPCPRCPVKP